MEASKLVNKVYYDVCETFSPGTEYNTIEELFNNIDDKWSYYYLKNDGCFSKNNYKNYVGIGVWLSLCRTDKPIRVIGTINGGAAHAVLEAGDTIVSIDDNIVKSGDIGVVVNQICGRDGTTVKLSILRNENLQKIILIRSKVNPSKIITHTVNCIRYIYFSNFCDQICEQFLEIIKDNSKINGYIIDVRCNPGGLVVSCIKILDMLLRVGKTIAHIKTNKKTVQKKSKDDPITNLPIVVLVNRYTLSAAELFAISLQENGRALLFGEKTYGKSLIQTKHDLSGRFGVVITDSCFLSPNKKDINTIGVLPDVNIDSQLFQSNLFGTANDPVYKYAQNYLFN